MTYGDEQYRAMDAAGIPGRSQVAGDLLIDHHYNLQPGERLVDMTVDEQGPLAQIHDQFMQLNEIVSALEERLRPVRMLSPEKAGPQADIPAQNALRGVVYSLGSLRVRLSQLLHEIDL